MIARRYALCCCKKPVINAVSQRSGAILTHASPLPPTPPGKEQRHPVDKQLFQKYTIVDETERHLMPMASIILIKKVDGIGKAGEVVSVRSHTLREFYFPSKSAVYATPYNIEKYSKLLGTDQETTVEPYVKLGISKNLYELCQYVNGRAIPVLVALEHPWTLEKWNVVVALSLQDIGVQDNQVILNGTPVTGPSMKLQNLLFRFYIVANKRFVIPAYGRYQHVTRKTFKQMLTPSLPDPTALGEQEIASAGLIEEDIYVHKVGEGEADLSSMADEQIWRLMTSRMELKRKDQETNPVLISRREQDILDAEAKKKREREIEVLRCQSFNLPMKLDPWDPRELQIAKQRAKRNRYWDDDLHIWNEPLGKI